MIAPFTIGLTCTSGRLQQTSQGWKIVFSVLCAIQYFSGKNDGSTIHGGQLRLQVIRAVYRDTIYHQSRVFLYTALQVIRAIRVVYYTITLQVILCSCVNRQFSVCQALHFGRKLGGCRGAGFQVQVPQVFPNFFSLWSLLSYSIRLPFLKRFKFLVWLRITRKKLYTGDLCRPRFSSMAPQVARAPSLGIPGVTEPWSNWASSGVLPHGFILSDSLSRGVRF